MGKFHHLVMHCGLTACCEQVRESNCTHAEWSLLKITHNGYNCCYYCLLRLLLFFPLGLSHSITQYIVTSTSILLLQTNLNSGNTRVGQGDTPRGFPPPTYVKKRATCCIKSSKLTTFWLSFPKKNVFPPEKRLSPFCPPKILMLALQLHLILGFNVTSTWPGIESLCDLPYNQHMFWFGWVWKVQLSINLIRPKK